MQTLVYNAHRVQKTAADKKQKEEAAIVTPALIPMLRIWGFWIFC